MANSRMSMANSRLSMATSKLGSTRPSSRLSDAYSTITMTQVDEDMKRKLRPDCDVSMVTLLQPNDSMYRYDYKYSCFS